MPSGETSTIRQSSTFEHLITRRPQAELPSYHTSGENCAADTENYSTTSARSSPPPDAETLPPKELAAPEKPLTLACTIAQFSRSGRQSWDAVQPHVIDPRPPPTSPTDRHSLFPNQPHGKRDHIRHDQCRGDGRIRGEKFNLPCSRNHDDIPSAANPESSRGRARAQHEFSLMPGSRHPPPATPAASELFNLPFPGGSPGGPAPHAESDLPGWLCL